MTRIENIGSISVDCLNALRGKYPDELLEAFTFIGKYMLLASLPQRERSDIGPVSNTAHCPLCQVHLAGDCEGCALHEGTHIGCGLFYHRFRHTVENGSFLEICTVLAPIVRRILHSGA